MLSTEQKVLMNLGVTMGATMKEQEDRLIALEKAIRKTNRKMFFLGAVTAIALYFISKELEEHIEEDADNKEEPVKNCVYSGDNVIFAEATKED